jgi:hypothetical protein
MQEGFLGGSDTREVMDWTETESRLLTSTVRVGGGGGCLLEEGELVLEPLLGELLGGRDREELSKKNKTRTG